MEQRIKIQSRKSMKPRADFLKREKKKLTCLQLAKFTKEKERTQIKNERDYVTTDITEIQMIISTFIKSQIYKIYKTV